MPETLELGAVFLAGLLTFVTPCVLPLIPVYLALLAGDAGDAAASPGDEGARGLRARLSLLYSTLLFSLGMVVVFIALGLTATALGQLLAEHRTQMVVVGGLLIFLFGLKFLGWLQIPWLDRERRIDGDAIRTGSRTTRALVMGVVFSLGWTPCVGPILGSVLTYTAAQTADPLRGAGLLAAYGLGFVTPLLLLSLFADVARKAIARLGHLLPRISQASGALLAGVGLWLILGAAAPPEATRSALPAGAATQPAGPAISPPLGKPTLRPRMVQFSSPACSVCRQMIPTVAVVERDCHGRKVDLVKVDVERAASRRLATAYGVRGVPTFVFLSEKGDEVARLVGYQTLDALRQALAALVGEQCDGLGLFNPGAIDRGKKCSSSGANCGG